MSGTSMDGVDVTLVETDGEIIVRHGEGLLRLYTDAERALISTAAAAARDLADRQTRLEPLTLAEAAVTDAHIDAMAQYLRRNRLAAADIDVAGFHGKMVLRRPDAGLTIRIGDGPRLARETGVNIVFDMRGNDMAQGRQGAPLVPVYYRALSSRQSSNFPSRSQMSAAWPMSRGSGQNMKWLRSIPVPAMLCLTTGSRPVQGGASTKAAGSPRRGGWTMSPCSACLIHLTCK